MPPGAPVAGSGSAALADAVFSAFAWRRRPSPGEMRACRHVCQGPCFLGHHGLGVSEGKCLGDVAPKDLTLEMVEEQLDYPDPLTCFRTEAFLYYLPAFLSFVIADPGSDKPWGSTVAWLFRCCPFEQSETWLQHRLLRVYSPLEKWPQAIRDWSAADDWFRRDLAVGWFLVDDEWHTAEVVSSMTMRERQAVAACFDFLGRNNARGAWNNTDLESAGALLRGRPASEVLGAGAHRPRQELAHLIDALGALRDWVPESAQRIAVVVRAVRDGTTVNELLTPLKATGKT